jgi:hypothetical protein
MTEPRSNSRRFVKAAWSLLTFQLIASAGAVAVTGVAAFHVRDLVSGVEQGDASVDAAVEEAADAAAPAVDAGLSEAPPPPAPVAPAGPVNDGAGTLTLAQDQRGNINASLFDPDGVSGTPQIQWFRNGALAPNAAGPTYTVGYQDSQAAITARASYTDGDGFTETVASQPVQIGVIIP